MYVYVDITDTTDFLDFTVPVKQLKKEYGKVDGFYQFFSWKVLIIVHFKN